jgi:hypothetical protein
VFKVIRRGRNRYSLQRDGRTVATRKSRYLARGAARKMWYTEATAKRKDKKDG